ncbi:phospholipase D-like domain-containing protein [Kurthia sp. Dielmo]|uniref:phospholipase D-like domain-containing protein n=1 Tax=Kurthia sp. Dielmo TaxID=1033738 RepID=UPI00111D2DB2|nr:phospholipase D-like domain-containing protein [Kurthia sp. Dielmo]
MKKRMKVILCILILIPLFAWNWHTQKALPQGMSVDGKFHQVDNVEFLTDITYEKNDKAVMEQQLFERTLQIIDEAKEVLVIDLFLYNDDYNHQKATYDNRAEQLTKALIEKRKEQPDMPIQIITDNVNSGYGSIHPQFFKDLATQNIEVLTTNLTPLRDSNPLYSSVWRSYLQWWPVSTNGFLPNLFNPDGDKMSVGAYLDLVNFKANHRKIVLNEQEAMVISANVSHDGSSLHSNIGFVVKGAIVKDIYESENAILHMSDKKLPKNISFVADEPAGDINVKLVTEGKIQQALTKTIKQAKAGDTLKIGVFYIAEREIIHALKDAAKRGVNIQMILDANRDAFGIKKNGVPNRPVAHELMKEDNITVRWYDTHGEQYHSKFLMLNQADTFTAIGGSANFTRRNIDDYNLETDLYMTMPKEKETARDMNAYFERLWTNQDGIYTVDYEEFADGSLWKTVMYRIQEFTGLSTF